MNIDIINDDNLVYKFLDNLDYNKLDYSDITNLYYLCQYIEYKIILGYDDYHNMLEIIKNHSLICYYNILSKFNYDYNDDLLKLEPLNIIEKIIFKGKSENDKLTSTDINIKNNIIDEIINYNDELTKDNIIINTFCKEKQILLKRKWDVKPTREKLFYTINYLIHKINVLDYKSCIPCLEILKNDTVINKNYLNYLEIKNNFLINNKIDINVLLDYNNKIYNSIHNYKYIYLKHKYDVINDIVFNINRLKNNVDAESLIKQLVIIYESYKKDDNITDDLLSLNMFINIEYLMYSIIAKYTSDKNKKEEYYNLSIKSILRTKNLNNYPNKILDLIILYFASNNYNKVIEYYEKYKYFMIDRYKNEPIVIRLYCIVINSYVYTHKIQNINDLYDLTNQLEYNEIFKNSFEWIEQTKKTINFMYNIVSCPKFNFSIIENYDLISDSKCLRDNNNKIICTICLENVEQDKITLIQCNKCDKYIGHIYCIYNYICHKNGNNVKCLNCQQ